MPLGRRRRHRHRTRTTKGRSQIRKSIKQAQSEAAEFHQILASQYPPTQVNEVFRTYADGRRATTLRVNTLKADTRTVLASLQRQGIKCERVAWYDDALILKSHDERDIAKTSEYQQGQVYLQSLSSMLPPLVLGPKPGQLVIDMAAAPGGKTTQIAALSQNQARLIACEIDAIRVERLRYNVALQGAQATIVHGDAKQLWKSYAGQADAVLLDAPCSGTGTLEPRDIKGFSAKRLARYVAEQRRLLRSAVKLLRPGGVLVYSTCSILREENQENVEWLLAEHGNLKLKPHELGINPRDTMLSIMPDNFYEGFFVAKMQLGEG